MRFKIDENLPIDAALLLVNAGHDALTVLDQNLNGAADTRIATVCREEQRAIVTFDLDFSDIRKYPPSEYHGLVVLRLLRQDRDYVLDELTRLLPVLEQETLSGTLWIVDEDRIRIRS